MNIRMKRFFVLLTVFLLTRLIYSGIGVFSRNTYLDPEVPFTSWTYDSPFELLNVWTVWDSGQYYSIAKEGYPRLTEKVPSYTLNVPANSWTKVFLGTATIAENNYTLPFDRPKMTNTLIVLGSGDSSTSVQFLNAQAGMPYCTYSGAMDYERDVNEIRGAFDNPNSCGDSSCEIAVLTYYSAVHRTVVYQEEFYKDSAETLNVFNAEPPSFYFPGEFSGKGCQSVEPGDIEQVYPRLYEHSITVYPFFPFYSYLTGALSQVVSDTILSGVIISFLATFISAYFLYLLLSEDFEERTAFYAALLYLVQPFGFILSGFMTEGLFGLILFMTLYSARKGRVGITAILLAVLSVTRIYGGFVGLPIVWIYKKIFSTKKFVISSIFTALLAPALLLWHMYHLYILTDDPLALLNAQKAWGRAGGFFLDRLFEYWSYSGNVAMFETIVFAMVFVLCLLGLFLGLKNSEKRIPIEYWIYTGTLFVLTIISGTLTSFPRFSVGIFLVPLIPMLFVTKTSTRNILLIISFILSCIFMGIWVLSSHYLV